MMLESKLDFSETERELYSAFKVIVFFIYYYLSLNLSH